MAQPSNAVYNCFHLDELINDNLMCVNDPFVMGSHSDWVPDHSELSKDTRTDGLVKALAEAMGMPDNVSLDDVLGFC